MMSLGSKEKKRNDLRYRITRTMLKNAHLQNISFISILKSMDKTMRAFLEQAEEEVEKDAYGNVKPKDTAGVKPKILHVDHFKIAINRLNLGLSIVQTEDLLGAFDADGSQTIDANHFKQFLYYAKDRMEKETEWKEDSRAMICDSLLRLVTPNDVLPAVLKQLHYQLNHDQVHKLRPGIKRRPSVIADSVASFNSQRRGSTVGMTAEEMPFEANSRTVEYDSEFDATWCPPGEEIVMPPGSKPTGAHWTATKVQDEAKDPPQPRSRRGSLSASSGGRKGSVSSAR
jgi:hypothetical protein